MLGNQIKKKFSYFIFVHWNSEDEHDDVNIVEDTYVCMHA